MEDSPGSTTTTTTTMGQRGEKRPLSQQQQQQFQIIQEPSKRRAPYATQACDACRRRKGRCDGQKPCEYCHQRTLECVYSSASDRKQEPAPAPSQAHPTSLSELTGLVTSLQDQVTALTSIVESHHRSSEHTRTESTLSATRDNEKSTSPSSFSTQLRPSNRPMSMSDGGYASSLPAAAKRSKLPFYGPTSPEFSLIAAKNTLSREKEQHAGTADHSRIASSSYEDVSDDEDQDSTVLNDSGYGSPPKSAAPQQPSPGLLQFTNAISKTEANRLLGVYQEIIGEIHPVCDIESMTRQLDRWYGWVHCVRNRGSFSGPNFDVVQDTDELLILGLALTTAMSAEAVSRSHMAKQLYNGFKDIVFAKLVAPVNTEKDVTITLMMGFYAYFNCELHTAWRMCGLAGRMAMQLGMHSRDMAQRLERDGSATDLATLACSIVVLDRQLSAASGLPPNFNFADFDSAQADATQNPYLKAMMSFSLMSHRFNDPISHAARGEGCDEDSFDVTVFKIEQWRKRTLDTQTFSLPVAWESNPATRPPSWMTMLYLRANAVRTILLRPFFISPNSSSANEKIKSGLELITNTVATLSILDRASDTYRKQHPQFQHFLASSCALLFLLVAYVAENHSSCHSELPDDYIGIVRQVFHDALNLSAAYRDLSPASRKLWKRLITMRELLIRKSILPRGMGLMKDGQNANFSENSRDSNGNRSSNDFTAGDMNHVARAPSLDDQINPHMDPKRSTLQLTQQQSMEFPEAGSSLSMFEMPNYSMMSKEDMSMVNMDFSPGDMLGDLSGIAGCFGLEWPSRDGTTDFFTDGL